jgi:hypothetical protein
MKNRVQISVSLEIVDRDLLYLYTFTVSHSLKVKIKVKFEYELCDVNLSTTSHLKTGSKETSTCTLMLSFKVIVASEKESLYLC